MNNKTPSFLLILICLSIFTQISADRSTMQNKSKSLLKARTTKNLNTLFLQAQKISQSDQSQDQKDKAIQTILGIINALLESSNQELELYSSPTIQDNSCDTELANLITDKSTAQNRITSYQQEIILAQSKQSDAEAKLTTLEKELSDLQASNDSLTAEANDYNSAIDHFKSLIEDIKSQMASLSTSFALVMSARVVAKYSPFGNTGTDTKSEYAYGKTASDIKSKITELNEFATEHLNNPLKDTLLLNIDRLIITKPAQFDQRSDEIPKALIEIGKELADFLKFLLSGEADKYAAQKQNNDDLLKNKKAERDAVSDKEIPMWQGQIVDFNNLIIKDQLIVENMENLEKALQQQCANNYRDEFKENLENQIDILTQLKKSFMQYAATGSFEGTTIGETVVEPTPAVVEPVPTPVPIPAEPTPVAPTPEVETPPPTPAHAEPEEQEEDDGWSSYVQPYKATAENKLSSYGV